MNIDRLYEEITQVAIEPVPVLSDIADQASGHTMGAKLIDYIRTKLTDGQKVALRRACERGWKIRVVGAYGGHEPIWIERLQESYIPEASLEEERFWTRVDITGRKKFNRRRPSFLLTQDRKDSVVLNVVTFPSREYVQQVAGIVSAAVRYDLLGTGADAAVAAITFPSLEREVGEWTGLRSALAHIPAHDLYRGVAIFGYVEQIHFALNDRPTDFTRVECEECNLHAVDRMFEVKIYQHASSSFRIVTFGFDHTYWGSASAGLVSEFLRAGIKHVIYFAKLGARIPLSGDMNRRLDPHRLTGGMVVPRGPFHSIRFNEQRQYEVSDPIAVPSLLGLAANGGWTKEAVATGTHFSVPSVVGETRVQESYYNNHNPTTIDNEIAFMASAAKSAGEDVTFDCLHYVTDFVTPMTSAAHSGHAGLDKDTRGSKGPKLISAASFLLDDIEHSMRAIKPVPRGNGHTHEKLRSEWAATRDYASLFQSLPRDYPEWLRPNKESICLRSMPAERAVLLATVRRLPSDDLSNTDLLSDVLSDAHPCIDISGLPNGGKSLVAKALYFELLARFEERRSALRPLLLELKALEHYVRDSDNTFTGQEELLKKKLDAVAELLAVEAAVGPVILIVNGMDSSSPMFEPIRVWLNQWRVHDLEHNTSKYRPRLVEVKRRSEWIGSDGNDSVGAHGYWANIDVASLKEPSGTPLLDALCRFYDRTREQFLAAIEKAVQTTGERSPTWRVVVQFAQGKAKGDYFDEITEALSGSRFTSHDRIEAARLAYDLVVAPNPKPRSPLTALRRVVTDTEEMTAHYAASHILNQIRSLAERTTEGSLGPQDFTTMDRVFSHRITRQLKRQICATKNGEFDATRNISKLWNYLQDNRSMLGSLDHFKSVLMYVCGRLEDKGCRKIGCELLQQALQSLPLDPVDSGALSLHRTVHISLMLLGEDGSTYFRYLRRKPEYDEMNRGFHLTYYHDQEYWRDPQMDALDRGGRFANTYKRLTHIIELTDKLHAVNAYTVISLFVNRFRHGTLECTVPRDHAIELMLELQNNMELPLEVRSYARWAHHYIKTGVSVVLQAIIGLKREPRAGWNYGKRSMNDPESVADHSMSALLLARVFLPEDAVGVDQKDLEHGGEYSKAKVIDMLAVHDMAEGLLGDIVDPIRQAEHDEEERGLLMAIASLAAAGACPVPASGCAQMDIDMAEFQSGRTVNALIARDLDKVDNLLQLEVYRADRREAVPDVDQFSKDVRSRLQTRTVAKIWDAIHLEIAGKALSQLTNTHQTGRRRSQLVTG